ncbi:MAG: bifunctional folylpolyglutamate synthase/dihydrofolate synthase [Bacteroidetes bacterium]|nr:bifunctional folylpolyglutamate synthase/dihydrofolate synthase [Bacteroidota bacterium]
MPTKQYQNTIDWLFSRFPSYQAIGASAYKPGLENTIALANHFGNPQNKLTFIHVAGSNGKGSICSLLASVYKESGLKVGLFTSPHLIDFTERIRINGQTISQQFVIDFCEKVKSLQLNFSPSFFEITWVMALSYFEKQQCDLVVAEVGLGGRLDATNIIQPLISVISNISLEHTQFLGNTLEEIAAEKAGIIKSKTPIITAEKQKNVLEVFEKIAASKESECIRVTDFEVPKMFPLLGEHQSENWACVDKVINLLQARFPVPIVAIDEGLRKLTDNTGFMGRLQVIQENPKIIYDVSHNTDGINKTLQYLSKSERDGQLIIVYGTSADKNLNDILPLFPKNTPLFITEFSNERTARVKNLQIDFEKNELEAKFFTSPQKAMKEAKLLASNNDTILVFGSFFLIHEFLK